MATDQSMKLKIPSRNILDNKECTLSKAAYEKLKKRNIKKYDVSNIIAAWYKYDGVISLYREDGGFVDQLIFQKDNPHYKLQGYVFKGA